MYYELAPVYDTRKSFYNKAYVDFTDNDRKLYSYGSLVCEIKDNEVIMYNGYNYDSYTTRRHKREFLRQEGYNPDKYL